MKKIATMIFCLACITFLSKGQTSAADFQGFWTLTVLEGNDTAVVLSPEQIASKTDNYLHDFPLGSTTLTCSGSDFTMTHHEVASMTGTYDVSSVEYTPEADPSDTTGIPPSPVYLYDILTLHAAQPSCSSCGPKDFVFIIRSHSSTQLVLDIFDEDMGSTTYARMTFTK